jgi:hypothetical protein
LLSHFKDICEPLSHGGKGITPCKIKDEKCNSRISKSLTRDRSKHLLPTRVPELEFDPTGLAADSLGHELNSERFARDRIKCRVQYRYTLSQLMSSQ